jgi:hypothetical protein
MYLPLRQRNTGKGVVTSPVKRKSADAVELGRRGGKARAKKLSL